MNKQAISVTLEAENLLWLRAQALSQRSRSLSQMLDDLIREARTINQSRESAGRSVVGTVRITDADPNLDTADAAVRAFFSAALGYHTEKEQKSTAHSKTRRRAVTRKGETRA